MAWTKVQEKTRSDSGANSYTIGFTSTTTPGNMIIACIATDGHSATSVSGCGATWSKAASASGTGVLTEIWVGRNCGANTDVTFNFSTLVEFALDMHEWSGGATVSPVDQTNTNTGNSGTGTPGSVTPTNSGDLLIVSYADLSGGVMTGPASWTGLSSTSSGSFTVTVAPYYLVPASTSAQNPSATLAGSGQWAAVQAALFPAGGGSGVARRRCSSAIF